MKIRGMKEQRTLTKKRAIKKKEMRKSEDRL